MPRVAYKYRSKTETASRVRSLHSHTNDVTAFVKLKLTLPPPPFPPVWLCSSYHDPSDTGLEPELLHGLLGHYYVAAGAAVGHDDDRDPTFSDLFATTISQNGWSVQPELSGSSLPSGGE